MRTIARNDRILNITHYDLDGVCCSIILKKIFSNLSIIPCKFGELDHYLPQITFRNFDHVILTDIHPNDKKILEISDKIILLDHHESAMEMNDPKKMKFIVSDFCGAKLTKKFFEKYYNISLKELDNLIYLANDYDMWLHKNPKSRMLNELYGKYQFEKFIDRFANGNTRFVVDEIKYIRRRIEQFKKVYDELPIMPLKKINAVFCQGTEYLNDICEWLMKKDGYKIVFCLNTKSHTISVRHCIENFHVGEFLKNYCKVPGGGHRYAGGINNGNNIAWVKEVLIDMEQKLYDQLPQIRK